MEIRMTKAFKAALNGYFSAVEGLKDMENKIEEIQITINGITIILNGEDDLYRILLTWETLKEIKK